MPFNQMYKQNYLIVCQLANRIVRDDVISKDISQDVFIKLHKALSEGKQILNVQSWLYRVTVNHCFNHLRSIRKNDRTFDNIQIAAESEPEGQIIELEEAKRIRDLMLRLKKKEQLILALYSEGMSYKEMADASGIPINSVGNTLLRALTKLKKLCHESKC